MVYTQALVFGYGLSVKSKEDSAGDLRQVVHNFETPRFETRGGLKKAMSVSSLESACSFEEDCEEKFLHLDLTARIEKCLSDAKRSSLRCRQLLLPRHLTARVGRDVLRASVDEPCGLRGALISVFLETKGTLQTLGTVTTDQSLTPTFELSIVFKHDAGGWPPLKHLFGTDKALRLRPEYRLIKRKLYSSASPTVHEYY